MIENLGGRKFINSLLVNIILASIIFIIPEMRDEAMVALLVNNGIYTTGNVLNKVTNTQTK